MSPRYDLFKLERLAFCSLACVENALEYHDDPAKRLRVSLAIAEVIACYGCGLYLDETRWALAAKGA